MLNLEGSLDLFGIGYRQTVFGAHHPMCPAGCFLS
jgi:hypothetical protein